MKFGGLSAASNIEASYSLEGEDRIALSLLREALNLDYEYFYLDIGANHPKKGNNTMLFYELGKKGICIDPLPSLKDKYKLIRPRDIFLNEGIAESSVQRTLYIYADDTASTMDQDTAIRYNKKFEVEQKLKIESRPIKDIFEKLSIKNITIPMISIDIEGLDYQVLKSLLEIPNICYELIIIEDKLVNINSNNSINDSTRNTWHLFNSHGYCLISKTPLNSIYVRKKSDIFKWIPSVMLR